jgi:hypothetical protein
MAERDPWAAHVGRSFTGTMMEDVCPCGQAPCGLVDTALIDAECIQHPWKEGRTLRQMHNAKDCPGAPTHG